MTMAILRVAIRRLFNESSIVPPNWYFPFKYLTDIFFPYENNKLMSNGFFLLKQIKVNGLGHPLVTCHIQVQMVAGIVFR